jgi:hypothetical protein
MVNIWLMMVNNGDILASKKYLVGGAITHLEKYEFVNGKDDIPYMKWKTIKKFETTNQTAMIYIFIPTKPPCLMLRPC